MKKILIIVAIMASTTAFAQRTYWTFNYSMSFASGEQQDYITDASFRGWSMDGRGFLTDNISIGGSFSWEVFDEIKRDLPPRDINVSDLDNVVGSISGTEYRYLNTLPIMVNAHYYLGSEGALRPYFGLGIGTSYVDVRTDIGFISIASKKWGFALQPEVGVMIPFGLTGTTANIAGRFRYTTKTEDNFPISFFTLAVGLGFAN